MCASVRGAVAGGMGVGWERTGGGAWEAGRRRGRRGRRGRGCRVGRHRAVRDPCGYCSRILLYSGRAGLCCSVSCIACVCACVASGDGTRGCFLRTRFFLRTCQARPIRAHTCPGITWRAGPASVWRKICESSEALAELPEVARSAVELRGCCARVSLAARRSSINTYFFLKEKKAQELGVCGQSRDSSVAGANHGHAHARVTSTMALTLTLALALALTARYNKERL